jgi:hypothetical protein
MLKFKKYGNAMKQGFQTGNHFPIFSNSDLDLDSDSPKAI